MSSSFDENQLNDLSNDEIQIIETIKQSNLRSVLSDYGLAFFTNDPSLNSLEEIRNKQIEYFVGPNTRNIARNFLSNLGKKKQGLTTYTRFKTQTDFPEDLEYKFYGLIFKGSNIKPQQDTWLKINYFLKR